MWSFSVTNIFCSNLCQFFLYHFLGKYGGERSGVECDTKTPGCEHMCMNHLFPIGPPFFWTLEIIALSLPTLFFIVYISHKQNQGFAIDEDHCKDNIEVAHKERFQNCSNCWLVNLISLIPPMKTHKRIIQRNSGTFTCFMLQFACSWVLACLLHIFISIFSLLKCQIDIFVIEHLVLVWPHAMLVSLHNEFKQFIATSWLLHFRPTATEKFYNLDHGWFQYCD